MCMRIIRIPNAGSGKTIIFISFFIVNLERNEDIASLVNGIQDIWFMENLAGGEAASLGSLIDETGKVFRVENFPYLA